MACAPPPKSPECIHYLELSRSVLSTEALPVVFSLEALPGVSPLRHFLEFLQGQLVLVKTTHSREALAHGRYTDWQEQQQQLLLWCGVRVLPQCMYRGNGIYKHA